jgi:ribose transport system substrate-binding protein
MATKLTKLIAIGTCVAPLLLAGCGRGGGDNGGAAAKKPVLGLSMHFMADDYSKDFAKAVQTTGASLGLEVRTSSADSDPNKQLSDIQNFVSQGVNVLIVIPIDEAAILPALKSAADAKIPVLSASPIPGASGLKAVVGPSDFENGKAACNEMVAAMKRANKGMDVAISTASVTLYRIEQREKGCRAALDAAGATVVGTAKGLSPEEGLANAQNLISAHPGLDGIFGSFSNLVIGAANALKRANRKDISVSGIDADRAIIQLITEGYVTAVAAQLPTKQAQLITQAAKDVVDGKQVAADQQSSLPTTVVNAANAKEMYQQIWGAPFGS